MYIVQLSIIPIVNGQQLLVRDLLTYTAKALKYSDEITLKTFIVVLMSCQENWCKDKCAAKKIKNLLAKCDECHVHCTVKEYRQFHYMLIKPFSMTQVTNSLVYTIAQSQFTAVHVLYRKSLLGCVISLLMTAKKTSITGNSHYYNMEWSLYQSCVVFLIVNL